MMPMTFSASSIWANMSTRIEQAVNLAAEEAAVLARERAPVRKVFRGSVGLATLQSHSEVKAEAHLRRQAGLAPGPVLTQRTPVADVHSNMSFRSLNRNGTLRNRNVELTGRGRYELKSRRAVFKSASGVVTLGGRLKGEIHVVPAEGGGPTWVAKVVSPTAYAKYVEFGTRHNRAQPYLRPALEQVRESFRARCVSAVSGAGRAA